jgi:cytochrome oxidase assembly protein ShyY1
MSLPQAGHVSRSFLLAALFAAVGLIVLIGLGVWQVQRKTWKEALTTSLQQRITAAPSELPAPQEWPRLTQDDSEFRRVKVKLEFLDKPHAFLYASGSALREDIKTLGYFVFAPARLPGGEIVAVDIGWVPEHQQHQYPRITGPAEIVGYLRWPESPNWFVSSHNPTGEAWFVRDHRAMAQLRSWGEPVAPFYIDQEGPQPPGGLPKPGPLSVKLRNDHLGYALTWFGLAATLVAVFGFWAWGRRENSDARSR